MTSIRYTFRAAPSLAEAVTTAGSASYLWSCSVWVPQKLSLKYIIEKNNGSGSAFGDGCWKLLGRRSCALPTTVYLLSAAPRGSQNVRVLGLHGAA